VVRLTSQRRRQQAAQPAIACVRVKNRRKTLDKNESLFLAPHGGFVPVGDPPLSFPNIHSFNTSVTSLFLAALNGAFKGTKSPSPRGRESGYF
jgi:hypothetical protein